MTTGTVCTHSSLMLEPSDYASEAGFLWAGVQKRAAAMTPQGRASAMPAVSPKSVFPAPLVLPGDDLALDPKYPAQSLRSWIRLKERNQVTNDRRTIYVTEPPSVDPSINDIRSWTRPVLKASTTLIEPQTREVIDYLAAFYHGLPIKKLPIQLIYTNWDDGKASSKVKSKKACHIGLDIGTECIRIRTRASQDVFIQQLNLDDLLDAAISVLPDDAYALLLLVSHDIYESEEDDFACGRAYGGSRVAVVSTARYNPALDVVQNIEREHAWPASHCSAYVQSFSESTEPSKKKRRQIKNSQVADTADFQSGPVYAALNVHRAQLSHTRSEPSSTTLSGLWLARVCRTASHELGHCFGMDHCVYYACAMQGTASLAEDARQPPYICPVDLVKVLRACSTTEQARYGALLSYCEKYRGVPHFDAFAAWIRGRLSTELAL